MKNSGRRSCFIVWDPVKGLRKPLLQDVFEAVYALAQLVPVGRVTSYSSISRVLGVHPRLVAYALKRNENPIAIPCHRVVEASGKLGGYSRGGAEVKKRLLELEGVVLRNGRVPREYFVDLASILLDP